MLGFETPLKIARILGKNNKHLGRAPSKTQNIAKIQTYS